MQQQETTTQEISNSGLNFNSSFNAYLSAVDNIPVSDTTNTKKFTGAIHIKLIPTKNTLEELTKLTNNNMCFNTMQNNVKFNLNNQDLIKRLFATYDGNFSNGDSRQVVNDMHHPPLKTLRLL